MSKSTDEFTMEESLPKDGIKQREGDLIVDFGSSPVYPEDIYREQSVVCK